MGHLRSYCSKDCGVPSEGRKWYLFCDPQLQNLSALTTGLGSPLGNAVRNLREGVDTLTADNTSNSLLNQGVEFHCGVDRAVRRDVVVVVAGSCVEGKGGSVVVRRVGVCEAGVGCLDAGQLEVERSQKDCGYQISVAVAIGLPSQLAVKARLKKVDIWRDKIKAPSNILSINESGYVIPLKSEPAPLSSCNHASVHRHFTLVQESISELCASGCILNVHRYRTLHMQPSIIDLDIPSAVVHCRQQLSPPFH